METEYKSYKLKKKINPILKICCMGVGIFFAIMWTSFIWIPKKEDVFAVTQLNVAINEPNTKRTLTLTRWDYSKEDKTMEAQFRIENKSFDGKDTYSWAAVDRKKGQLQVETVYEDTEILVVQIKKIPSNWSTISLRMGLAETDPNTQSLFKIYGDKTNIKEVEHIEKKDGNDYYILDFSNTITYYEEQILKENDNITSIKEKIKEVNKSIDANTKKLAYMTEQEAEEVMNEIRSLERTIEEYQDEISKSRETIVEYKQRISKLQEKIKAYQ